MILRALSYNLHKGFSIGNRRFVLEQMRESIEKTGADFLFLQEVQGEHRGHAKKQSRWPLSTQFEFLADRLWPHYAYGKNAVYESGHHGNAILSRYPVLSWDNLDLSNNRFEQRGALHVSVEIPGRPLPLHLVCLHLDLLEHSRLKQAQKLGVWIAGRIPPHHPVILAGDFNDWRGRISKVLHESLGLQEVFEVLEGAPARTFPSFFPLLQLDRIYWRNLELERAAVHVDAPWDSLSDHLAISAEFHLN